jgi:hypothetical protein
MHDETSSRIEKNAARILEEPGGKQVPRDYFQVPSHPEERESAADERVRQQVGYRT